MVNFTVFKGSQSGAITEGKTSKDLGPKQVFLRVTHSGVCGTDLHYKSADMALGHEGVGVVEEVGKDVKLFKKGDRAGWGYEHDCCGHCKQCLTGKETYCPERAMYGMADLDQGSFASHAVWNESFLFKIPDALSSEAAAPLQCGGITVYNALQMYPVKAGDRVGIIGVGGLGHLAIQFANKMGCEVVVFSGTDSKKEEAIKLGAHEFYATKDKKELKLEKPIDRLLVTASVQVDWNMYLNIMAPSAVIYPLSISEGNLEIPYMPLLLNGLRVQGTVVGPRQMHKDMLEFAAIEGIKPIVQTFPMSKNGVEKALKTLDEGKMRYRGVLVA